VASCNFRSREIDAAIKSLRTAVDALRRIDRAYTESVFASVALSIALALRGAVAILELARKPLAQLPGVGATGVSY